MSELKVPLALDQKGSIISPKEADRGTVYYCPGCGERLVFRKCNEKKNHFSHKATDACSYETIIHQLAKRQIADEINAYIKSKAESPIIERKCPLCKAVTEQLLPEKITAASVEKKLKSGFITDVAIEVENSIVAAIEVKVSHAVSGDKKEKIGVPFIELDGESILESPKRWKPLLDAFRPFKCRECEEAISKFKEGLLNISKESGVLIPKEYYRTTYVECWRCNKPILVFSWPDLENERQAPKEPRPKTIQYRFSKMAGSKYWANTCPYCKSIQGDFFLYSEPDSPLFGFKCGVDSVESYRSDMRALAVQYSCGW